MTGSAGEERSRYLAEGIVLDIGGDVGALVVYLPPGFEGREVEVSRAGDDDRPIHTLVLRRRVDAGVVLAAVFPALRQGRYRVLIDQPGAPDGLTIRGGRVTELDLRPPPQDGGLSKPS